jgi:hypothetical protein
MSTATTTVPIRRELERDPIFIKDDKFYTTAGVSAGSIHLTDNRDTERVSGAVWHSIARDSLGSERKPTKSFVVTIIFAAPGIDSFPR